MPYKLIFKLLVSLLLLSSYAYSQDKVYVKKLVKKLASPAMHGRGYVKQGDLKAAKLLAKEFEKAGLQHFGESYFQPYSFAINTFPGKVDVKINGQKLKPGAEVVINPMTNSVSQSYELIRLPDTITQIASIYALADTNQLEGKMLVIPEGVTNAYRRGIPGVSALVQTVEKAMWWHVSGAGNPEHKLQLKIKAAALPPDATTITVDAEAVFVPNYQTQNLYAYVPGSVQADSFFVFVAHYDHLGRMGKKTVYPGASDNASGTAAVVDLARYYAANPEKARYTMIFALVSGEEAGLLGSSYLAENPPFDLNKTRFVINFDMVGTGSEGLSVVNGKVLPEYAALMEQLNTQKSYFPDIRLGGESCNSDHCPFYKKGVPAFFLFTRGPENREYHTITDTPEKLPFTAYESLFGIVTDFVEAASSSLFDR
ncbi:MAG: M28 family peptidase [Bacteroidales bacterium]|nr:M28 family peptidase [Bacteroidales bacterium]